MGATLTQVIPLKAKGNYVCPWYIDRGLDHMSILKLRGTAYVLFVDIYSHVLNCLNLLLHIKMQWGD